MPRKDVGRMSEITVALPSKKKETERAAKLVVKPGTVTAKATKRLGRKKTAELKNLSDSLSHNYRLVRTPGGSTPARRSRGPAASHAARSRARWDQLSLLRGLNPDEMTGSDGTGGGESGSGERSGGEERKGGRVEGNVEALVNNVVGNATENVEDARGEVDGDEGSEMEDELDYADLEDYAELTDEENGATNADTRIGKRRLSGGSTGSSKSTVQRRGAKRSKGKLPGGEDGGLGGGWAGLQAVSVWGERRLSGGWGPL